MKEENLTQFEEKISDAFNTTDESSGFDEEDINNNKVFAILAYFGILVLIPIFAAKESKFARFHSNQGLILFLCAVICSVLTYIPVVKYVAFIVELFIFVLFIIGIVNAGGGKAKRLPVIGKFDILPQ